LNDLYGLYYLVDKVHGIRSRPHPTGCSNEKRIIEVLSQPGKAHADGGWTQFEILSSLSDTARFAQFSDDS
jgi:hypothetical protein